MKLVSVFAGFFIIMVSVGIIVVALNVRGQGNQNPFVETIRVTSEQISNVESGTPSDRRVGLNRVSVRLLKSNPVFGYGVGGWSYFYRNFADPLEDWNILFSDERLARGADGNYLRDENGRVFKVILPLRFDHAHNEYLQYLCEFGVIGAFLITLIVFWIPITILLRPRQMGFIALVSVGATAVVLLHSAIEFPTRTPGLGLVLGILLAVGAMDQRFRSTPEVSQTD